MKTLTNLFKSNIREYGMLIALIAIMAFFQWRTDGILMKPINITNLVLQNSYIIIMALGMLLIIVSGWIDLSVGSVAAFIGAIAAVMMVKWDFHWGVTILLSLLIGALIGAWQGYWVAYVKIPAFIVDTGRHVDFPRTHPGHASRGSGWTFPYPIPKTKLWIYR